MRRSFFSPLVLWLVVFPLEAQGSPSHPTIIRTQLQFVEAAKTHVREGLAALRPLQGSEAALLQVHTDPKGRICSRFQQYYRGVRVWGAQWLAHQGADGAFLEDSARFHEVRVASTESTLSASEALAVASQAMKVKGAIARHHSPELVLVPRIKAVYTQPSGKGPLNARDVRQRVQGHDLAYYTSLMVANAHDGVMRRDYLVDAHTGAILREWNSLETDAPSKGQGRSQYSGAVPLNTVQRDNGSYDLIDATRGTKPHPVTGLVGNATYDLRQQLPFDDASSLSGTLYNDDNDQWGDGQNYDPSNSTMGSNGQTAAVDAHFGLQVTWDTYKNVYQRDGVDGIGTSVLSRVHFFEQYPNAFWDTSTFSMNYGDGNPHPFMPAFEQATNVFTPLDVVAHEISHGVMAFSAGLFYYDEMGGLNESNSDIMSKMVEFYAYGAGGKGEVVPNTGGKWTLGSGILQNNDPLRWMSKPSKDGLSPDSWTPSLGLLDVHYSCGPNNRMFYFLCNGASPSLAAEDFSRFLPKGMSGVGNQKAGQIWYRALTQYLTPGDRYFDARKACIRAATDLYGELSPEYEAVQNAYAGINVGIAADRRKEDFIPPVVQGLSVSGDSGIVYFSSDAMDDRGMASVDYYVDGSYVGTATGNGNGFLMPFDSSTLSNGFHELTAVAFDTNQNAALSSVSASFRARNAEFDGLRNGSFEWGLDSWTIPSSHADQPRLTHFSRSGALALIFGGKWNDLESRFMPICSAVSQDLNLPSDCDTLTLSYWSFSGQPNDTTPPPVDGLAHDRMTIRLLDAQGNVVKEVGNHSNLDNTPDPWNPVWVQKSIDISDLKGRFVRLQVEASNDDQGYGTQFLADDFALNGTLSQEPSIADISGDGIVDGYDLALLMAAYGSTPLPGYEKVDLNQDSVVDDADLDLLLASFGK